jgi:serine protease Do
MVFCLVLALAFSGVLTTPTPPPAAAEESVASPAELEELNEFAGKLETLFQHAAEKVKPAVVSIHTTQIVEQRARSPFFRDPFFDEFFREFFGERGRRREKRPGLGSGMIIDSQGHILTNYHVIKQADELSVRLPDGRDVEAEVVGTDDKTDLAVIKMKDDFDHLPTVELGDSDALRIGQWVLAVGNPFGLTQTVSAGIVSATGRIGVVGLEYESMIQTDAAINPGNSGGPLVNLRGEVVGINTAIFSGTGGYMGIGFAIPSSMARDILDDLVAGREVERGWLGVYIADLTPEMAEMFGFTGTDGVLVQEILEGSPAEEAGLQAGDIITEYRGEKIEKMTQLRRRVTATDPGNEAELKVWRDGEVVELSVKIAALEAAPVTSDWLGLSVEPLTDEMARRLGAARLEGVLVREVEEDSPAARYITPGDVVLSVNRQRVSSIADYRKLVAEARKNGRVLLRYLDAETGRTRFIMIERR